MNRNWFNRLEAGSKQAKEDQVPFFKSALNSVGLGVLLICAPHRDGDKT